MGRLSSKRWAMPDNGCAASVDCQGKAGGVGAGTGKAGIESGVGVDIVKAELFSETKLYDRQLAFEAITIFGGIFFKRQTVNFKL